jgi:hypothetical protein
MAQLLFELWPCRDTGGDVETRIKEAAGVALGLSQRAGARITVSPTKPWLHGVNRVAVA